MRDDVVAMIAGLKRVVETYEDDQVVRNDKKGNPITAEDFLLMLEYPEEFPEVIEYAATVHGLTKLLAQLKTPGNRTQSN